MAAASPTSRPAETVSGIAGSIALLICLALGIKRQDILVALIAVIGWLPTAVTWLVVTIRGTDAPAREVAAANRRRP